MKCEVVGDRSVGHMVVFMTDLDPRVLVRLGALFAQVICHVAFLMTGNGSVLMAANCVGYHRCRHRNNGLLEGDDEK